jgi:hypothetical protein
MIMRHEDVADASSKLALSRHNVNLRLPSGNSAPGFRGWSEKKPMTMRKLGALVKTIDDCDCNACADTIIVSRSGRGRRGRIAL